MTRSHFFLEGCRLIAVLAQRIAISWTTLKYWGDGSDGPWRSPLRWRSCSGSCSRQSARKARGIAFSGKRNNCLADQLKPVYSAKHDTSTPTFVERLSQLHGGSL